MKKFKEHMEKRSDSFKFARKINNITYKVRLQNGGAVIPQLRSLSFSKQSETYKKSLIQINPYVSESIDFRGFTYQHKFKQLHRRHSANYSSIRITHNPKRL